ncbi:MAG: sigma-70 family RNA polymerase sigma factor [Phycisphaerales bacterium]|nr:sigma-70 family RNA polymerase sigma factor [Phycisphaerales bacterium]
MRLISVRTDEQIVDEVLSGERSAFVELVRRYERQVHAVVWGILRDHHAAEDVVQDVFVKAYERLGEWRGGALGAWLVVMARRAAIDQVRRGRRMVSEVPEMTAPMVEDAAEVLAAVGRLGEQEQQVILLRYFSGMSVAEIAGVLGCPVGTVTKRLSRAIVRLRDYLRVDQ